MPSTALAWMMMAMSVLLTKFNGHIASYVAVVAVLGFIHAARDVGFFQDSPSSLSLLLFLTYIGFYVDNDNEPVPSINDVPLAPTAWVARVDGLTVNW